MTQRAVSISLKIPDNTAYTACAALRRLGVEVDRVERSEIYFFDDAGDIDALVRQVQSDERLFNPNKHRLDVLSSPAPREGEVWIEPLEQRATLRPRAVAWRLFDESGPVRRAALDAATQLLLCNAAIDRAIYHEETIEKAHRTAAK